MTTFGPLLVQYMVDSEQPVKWPFRSRALKPDALTTCKWFYARVPALAFGQGGEVQSRLYKQAGNSVCVSVIKRIAECIAKEMA